METPSSTRRVDRSQALATANNSNNIPMSRKTEESEKGFSKSRQRNGKQQDRSVLIDITNDSPIVGLAMGSLGTPSSRMSKKRNNTTPGSGEALLRSQVKTLLQKVEEEAEFLTKLSFEHRSFLHLHQQGLLNSPIELLAPTPANTPDVPDPDLSGYKQLALAMPCPVQEKFNLSQMVSEVLFDGMKEKGLESEKNLISRSLLLDFSEKSERFDSPGCSSVVVTCEGGESGGSKEKSITDDDDASVWSIQVNASTRDEEEEDEENDDDDVIEEGEVAEEDEEDYDGDQEEEEDNNGGLVDELCEGMRNISVIGEKKMAKFTGKHTRFVYNSYDELEGEEECVGRGESEASSSSPGILRLKGLPTPKGKHLRFHEEIEEEP